MKHLKAVNKYFWKYRWRLIAGVCFIILSNYFSVQAPQIANYVVDLVQQDLPGAKPLRSIKQNDFFVTRFVEWVHDKKEVILICGLTILALALLRGLFMFFMRQTIIVMSRHIEYDQKNEVFAHYQKLDTHFYKIQSVGDLMNRIAEDVSRVRMYTGPAIMYLVNLATTIIFVVANMWAKSEMLTLYVLAPLPILAFIIYKVNATIHSRSEKIQGLLSDLTTNAQQSYSGIRVIKSYVQEKAMTGFFEKNSEAYRVNAIGLAKVEALYFPSMTLLIGISTLLTIMIGGIYAVQHELTVGIIVEFVLYINMLTFPVSAIGWVAGMVQRASASQKRLNEFLDTEPTIQTPAAAANEPENPATLSAIEFRNVSFTYAHTCIKALKHLNLNIEKGKRIAIIGKTGSGKSTVAQLLLRMYDVSEGALLIDGKDIRTHHLATLRKQISYVPQDVFLFSETVENNIKFGNENASHAEVVKKATMAAVAQEIDGFEHGYETVVGERGVTLSGGQKQRISIARALLKPASLVIFDDCLSAVDARTEKEVLQHLDKHLQGKTAIIITHRIFSLMQFDSILVMQDGEVAEQGTHESLLALNGEYATLYRLQQAD